MGSVIRVIELIGLHVSGQSLEGGWVIVVSGFCDDEDIWFLEGAQFNNRSPFVVVRNTTTNVAMQNMQSRCGGGWGCPAWLVCPRGGGVVPLVHPLLEPDYVTKMWKAKWRLWKLFLRPGGMVSPRLG